MPRRRPGSLRRTRRLDVAGPPPDKIPYLSRRVVRQIAFAEADAGLVPGGITRALRGWRGRTRAPFRHRQSDCPCPGCDPLAVRIDLAELLEALPRRERALMGTELAKADRRFLALTLPDPFAASPRWFDRRLADQHGWGPL